MELYLDGALTVGELKKALANLPDNAVVGHSMFGIVCHVEKTTRVLYNKEHNLVSMDHDEHAGAFSDEEFEPKTFRTIVEVP